MTPADEVYSDLAWAPTLDVNLIAMLRDKSPDKEHTDQDLCLLQLSKQQGPAQCIPDPDVNLVKTVRWAPDGKSIFALGQKGDINSPTSVFGIVRYTSKKAFSPDAKDWGKGKFVTDISNPGKGVIDFSISPDGKQMAAVANFDSDAFQLYLGKPKDFLLTEAKPQVVRACKVAWRSDGLELVVVQADERAPSTPTASSRGCRSASRPSSNRWASRVTTRPSSRCRWGSPCSARAAVDSSRAGPSTAAPAGRPSRAPPRRSSWCWPTRRACRSSAT